MIIFYLMAQRIVTDVVEDESKPPQIHQQRISYARNLLTTHRTEENRTDTS